MQNYAILEGLKKDYQKRVRAIKARGGTKAQQIEQLGYCKAMQTVITDINFIITYKLLEK